MVAHRAHPDLRILEREINPKTGKLRRDILVEQVRDADLGAARDRCPRRLQGADRRLRPTSSTPSGANALLKLLEEPPPNTIMLLVCQRPGILPRTILSRCMQLTL